MSLMKTKRASDVYTKFSPGIYDEFICRTRSNLDFGSSVLFNLVLVWLYNYFDLSVTNDSCVDETRVLRIKL